MPTSTKRFTDFGMQNDLDAVEDAIRNAPASVRMNYESVMQHDQAAEGEMFANRKQFAENKERGDDLHMQLMHVQDNEKRFGKVKKDEKEVDQQAPIKEKIADNRKRGSTIANKPMPRMIADSCLDYLNRLKGKPIIAADQIEFAPSVKLSVEGFAKIMAATDKEKANLRAIQTAPLPLAEVLESIPQYVANLACEPDLSPLFRGGSYAERTGKFSVDVPHRRIRFGQVRTWQDSLNQLTAEFDDIGFVCWAFPEKIIARLCELAKRKAQDDRALSRADKLVNLDEANQAITTALRKEVAYAFQLEAITRTAVHFREHIHPAIYLGIEVNPDAVVNYEA